MNWFKYRLPDTTEVVCGASRNLINDFGKGFVIAPFNNPAKGIKTIPFDFIPDTSAITPEHSSLPESTLKYDHRQEVETIIRSLTDCGGKVVAARVIRMETAIDLNATFDALCHAYTGAFVFMFSTQIAGTWIGASPELLLQTADDSIRTMSLAGTRPAGKNTEWDIKNIEEQSLVTSFILSCLSKRYIDVSHSEPFTKNAGNIEHICTKITARVPNSFTMKSSDEHLRDVLCELSPTPALCGSKRELSYRIIEQCEKFDREMYGGFCGPNDIDGKTSFYVNLRSAKCSESAICVFTGGGITPLSDPEKEWEETEIKSKTIITKIKKKNET